MRVCIYGAGAIGGYLGGQLALAGADVTLIARGPHLEAIQQNGLTLRIGGEERVAHPRSTHDPAQAGIQDTIILTLKAPSVPQIVDSLQPMMDAHTSVVTAVNGIPWWYFYELDSPWRNHSLQSVDPQGQQWKKIGPERAIGCVVYPACEVIAPGIIEHMQGNRFTLGEPSGLKTARVQQLSKAFINAGFKAPIRSQIRNEIWVKLWGNLCFNPISALTHAPLDLIGTDAGTRKIARTMMLEAQSIGEKLGVQFGVEVDQRIAGAVAVGSHKTSMLQDLERGRSLEIDALLTVVQEMGQLVGVSTPTIDLILALVQQRGRMAGVY